MVTSFICLRCSHLLRQAPRLNRLPTSLPRSLPSAIPRPAPLQFRRFKATTTDAPPPPIDAGSIGEEDLTIPNGLKVKAAEMKKQFDDIQKKLEESYSAKLAQEAGRLKKIQDVMESHEKQLSDLKELHKMRSTDPELAEMVADDIASTVESLKEAKKAIFAAFLPTHPFAHLSSIVEIRPGTGGAEALLFTADLYKMYTGYLQTLNWPINVMSLSRSEEAGEVGLNEVIFSVDVPGSYDVLRHEGGVHRVQRIPATETKGRVHTSTATVLVLPLFPENVGPGDEDPDSHIDPKDVKVEVMRARGAGGQHVNTTDSAVRLTHIPTGIIAAIQDARSQHKNREKAWTVLRSRVAEKRRSEREAKELEQRRAIMGDKAGAGGARGDKIRTYNFNQNRVTDHRCGWSSHDLDGVLSGEKLEDVVKRMREWETENGVQMVMAESK
ncbi:release factor [Ascobolus immersus RN42]|uniref:Release factor n=1 Tax=Ascobolus immersus RN42 TaxID=1160509 RepID=A0A3N4I545_ASCIM|nr:release factor [Ascobolus immersus RN42]